MSGHTPGPWIAEHRKGADGMYRTEVFSEQHGGIATCDWTPKHCGNGVIGTYREANARLIAAAPELLEALEAYEKWEAALIMADAAWVGGNPIITDGLYDKLIELQDLRNSVIAKARGEAEE